MKFNARLDTPHHRPPHQCKDIVIVSDSLTGIHNATVKFLFIVNRSCIHKGFRVATGKNPEDSNLASVEAMQCVHAGVNLHGVIENISHNTAKMNDN
jgi:hypothetical protein